MRIEGSPLNTIPCDYAHIIGQCSLNGELPLIIGGQCVNLCALYFADEEEGRDEYRPFTSADCDVVAGLDQQPKFTNPKPHKLSLKSLWCASPSKMAPRRKEHVVLELKKMRKSAFTNDV